MNARYAKDILDRYLQTGDALLSECESDWVTRLFAELL